MKIVSVDKLCAYLSDWQLNLRNTNECGGCEAELLERVIAAVNEMAVECDALNLPDSGQSVIRKD